MQQNRRRTVAGARIDVTDVEHARIDLTDRPHRRAGRQRHGHLRHVLSPFHRSQKCPPGPLERLSADRATACPRAWGHRARVTPGLATGFCIPAPAVSSPTCHPGCQARAAPRGVSTPRTPMPQPAHPLAPPPSPTLSPSQLAELAAAGEERTADVGEVLYQVGDREYPFIAIIEGEAAILDAAGNEIIRHGPSGFIGELNLLSGQTVFVTAVASKPLRYIAVPRDALRSLLYEDGPLSDVVLAAFIARREGLQRIQGLGLEIIGPQSSKSTMRIVSFARSNRLVFSWRDPEHADDPEAAARVQSLDDAHLPLVKLPGGVEFEGPSPGQLSRALGIGRELAAREEADLLIIGAGPAGLGAAVYGASEGLDTLLVDSTGLGGQAGTSRRIENYLGFPAGLSGSELTSRAVTQARKFNARLATPYRAVSLQAGVGRQTVQLEEEVEVAARAVVIATGAEYRRLPVADLDQYEGISIFYTAGPPEAQLAGAERVAVVGGGNSAGQAAVWLARGGALVTLLHRHADLRETMSDYLVREVDHYGVQVRDRSEIEALHGAEGHLEA